MNEIYSGWAAHFGAHQCPKCHIPIEKNDGCNHMTCIKCNHRWCWSCGLPVNHWVHTFSENPFGCKFTPANGKAMIWKAIFFLFGLVLIPLALVLFPIFAGLFYGLYGGCFACGAMCFKYNPKSCCQCILKIILVILAIPTFFITVGLSTGLGCLGGGLGAIASPFVLIIHTYMFGRSVYWWNKNRNHSFDSNSRARS